jgi:hypothetical protein
VAVDGNGAVILIEKVETSLEEKRTPSTLLGGGGVTLYQQLQIYTTCLFGCVDLFSLRLATAGQREGGLCFASGFGKKEKYGFVPPGPLTRRTKWPHRFPLAAAPRRAANELQK